MFILIKNKHNLSTFEEIRPYKFKVVKEAPAAKKRIGRFELKKARQLYMAGFFVKLAK